MSPRIESVGEHVRMEQLARDPRVVTIVLDRPARRNAADRGIANALREAFERFEADDASSVAVLWGAGGTFCAGADLTALNDDTRRNEIHADGSGPGPMGPTRLALTKPVIAAIAGHAVAGGLELAAWCDLRVAEEDAVLGVFCRRVGVPLIDGGTIRLPRLIGMSRALDLILTGRAVDAHEALAIGLVNRLAPPGEARSVAEALACELAALPQGALHADLRSVHENAFDDDLDRALQREGANGYGAVFDEGLDGAAHFVARPSDKGRAT
ncbi:enoyl-CoA hydratase [Burkholderia sp. SFA1]|uniref:crotonase/enoyl-CoA hydratase family protein n=1 Tax=unclassified Caballeronia TaxID=2646786 RepID=UPI001F33C79A|nr:MULTISPECIES: crotonase/enoyl-CoA hydratase family protein [unclassified Caballeronia]MCE4544179.1 crotonase/enoyl-CoA hydratase family protein [Caballeronia sp. PC1]MCE4571330.1 crotonase/enoyl-CoA hydratase family protein [Caballeronia sp. CLC5]BBP98754.1 enoyl-CoA hydratase [Burkholderia sp. SFA1]